MTKPTMLLVVDSPLLLPNHLTKQLLLPDTSLLVFNSPQHPTTMLKDVDSLMLQVLDLKS